MPKRLRRRSVKGKQEETRQVPQTELNDDLVAEDKASQQAYADSFRSLIERAVTDAEQIVANIKMKAQTEAEEEAVRIIDQAKQGAAEIRGRAEGAAQTQAEDILSAFNRKGEITEAEAKQMAQLYLLKAREEIEKEVREEYKQAHSRLLYSLLSTPEDVAPPLETSTPVQIETEPDTASKKKEAKLDAKEEAKRKAEEAKKAKEAQKQAEKEAKLAAKEETKRKAEEAIKAKEAQKQAEKEAKLAAKEETKRKAEEAKKAKEAQKQAEKEAKLAAKEETKRKAEEAKKAKEAQKQAQKEAKLAAKEETKRKAEEAKKAKEAQKQARPAAEESALEKKVEEPVQLETEVTVTEPAEAITEELPEQHPPEEKPSEEEPIPAPVELDREALYEGEVELAIAVPVDPAALSKLYTHLQSTPEIKILYTRGSWDRGTTITVTLDERLPLIDIISRLPGVEIAPVAPQKNSSAKGTSSTLLGTRGKRVTRIDLSLKER